MSHKAACWALYQDNLKPIQKLTLITLADCHNGATGQCNPSIEYIVKITGANRKSVIAALQYLESVELISRQRAFGKGYHYTLELDSKAPAQEPKVPKTVPYQKRDVRSTKNGTSNVPKTVLYHYIEPGIEPGNRTRVENTDVQASPAPDEVKPEKKAKTYKYSTRDAQLAQLLYDKVLLVDPGMKAPNLESWADTIRLINTRDGRDHEDIEQTIIAAHNDDFWRTNILSASGLRKHYQKVFAKLCKSTDYRNASPAMIRMMQRTAAKQERELAAKQRRKQERGQTI